MNEPINLETAQGILNNYVKAASAVSHGQEYTIDGRSLKRADLAEINKQVLFWSGYVTRLTVTGRSGPTVRRAIPHG